MESFFIFLSNFGEYGIALLALIEGFFLPIPVETITIPFYLANRDKIPFYFFILIIFSTLGASIGYFLSKKFSNFFINKISDKNKLEKLKVLYEKNLFITILSSAVTPIPYELYVFSSGIFKVNFKTFIFSALLSRFIRHFSQAILIYIYGEKILKNLNIYTLYISIFIFIIIIFYLIINFYIKNKKF